MRTSNVFNGHLVFKDIKYTTEQGYKDWTKRAVPTPDDVLFTREAPAGESCMVPDGVKVCLGQRMVMLRSEQEAIFPVFLSHSLISPKCRNRISAFTIGSTVSRINIADIAKVVINKPLLKEQQRIADFLTAVDTKIQQLKRKHSLMQQYKKGVMQQLFSQQVRFKDDDGRDYPDWKKEAIGKYLEEYKERASADTNMPILTSSRTGLYLQKDYYANRELQNEGEYGVLPKGYFTYRHMSDDLTFKFNLNTQYERGAISKEYPVFRTVGMNSYFLMLQLNEGVEFKKFAVTQKQGGTRTRLYFRRLKELKLLLPCLEEQQKIADFLGAIDAKITQLDTQITQAETFKKGLLQQMFV